MAIQCFTVVRAFRATVHHAARRVAGHHMHHRAVVKGVASHAAKFPEVVCVVAGLAAVGAGGFVAGSKLFGSSAPAPNEISSTINPPLSLGANSVGSLLSSLIASFPSDIVRSPDTPFSDDWGEADGLSGNPWTSAWREIGNPTTAWPLPVWHEIGNFQEIPSSPWPNEAGGLSDMPSQPGTVPEPASVSVLVASLCGAAILYRRNRTRPVAQAHARRQ